MAARRVAILGCLALVGCATEPEQRPPATPAAVVVGPAQRCIPITAARESRIRDDWTIDFIAGDRMWRNTLPSRCPRLRATNAFIYETSLSELCSNDIIYVLETAGGVHRGAGCGLDQFVPVKLAD